MAIKNNADIQIKINEVLTQVDPGSITPAEVKELIEDLKDSYANLTDHVVNFGMHEHNVSRVLPYSQGEATHKSGALWVNRAGAQGALSSVNYLQLTKSNVLFTLDTVNTSTNYTVGKLVRFENRAFERKVAGTISDVNDVYDTDEFTQLNVPIGYHGEPWVINNIYIAGMVMSATVGGRDVYLMNTSVAAMKSTDVSAEWISGKWKYVGEVTPSTIFLIVGNITLNITDIGKKFRTTGNYDVVFDSTLFVGLEFYCELYTIGGSTSLKVIDGGGGTIVGDGNAVDENGKGTIQKLTDSEFSLTGKLITIP